MDTSFLRPILFGTFAYKKYFLEEFEEKQCYVSKYVKMEFNRSFLRNVIYFYFILDLPSIQSVDDAFRFWSNKFKASELKAVIQLAAELFAIQEIDIYKTTDKENALYALGIVIKRYYIKSQRKFKDIGRDSTRCARSLVSFKAGSENMAVGFKEFIEAFDDVEKCRSLCRVDDFLLKRFKTEVQIYVNNSVKEVKNNKTNSGFKKIGKNLSKILEEGPAACSCKMCEKIGDAVIALDAPRDMRLEHIDNSFDFLCPPINQPHQKHPSEISISKNK